MRNILFIIFGLFPVLAFSQKAKWYDGYWVGKGIETNARPLVEWDIEFVSGANHVNVYYKGFPCQAEWELLHEDEKSATFTERLIDGTDKCANNLTTTIEFKKKKLYIVYYRGSSIKAIAQLKKKGKFKVLPHND